MTVGFAYPAPEPEPFTTIAWRLAHVIVGGLAMRNATYFGRTPTDCLSFDYSPTAAGALAQLDSEYATWQAGVESLGDEELTRLCPDAEGPFSGRPLGTLVLNINRELIHHLSEVCLLRDLYLRTGRPEGN